METAKWFLLALALGACGDNADDVETDADADADSDTDTDTDNDTEVSLLVAATFDGSDIVGEPYTVNDDQTVVDDGLTFVESIVKVTDSSVIWVGAEKSGWTPDSYRIAEIDGVRYVHPKADVGGDVIDVVLNMYADGEWTCDKVGSEFSETDEITFEEGQYLYLPFAGDFKVSGSELSYEADGVIAHGDFTSPTTITVTSTGGMPGDYVADCYAN